MKRGDAVALHVGFALLLAAGAVCTDLFHTKVPNGWIGLGLLGGFCLWTGEPGKSAAGQYGTGFLIPFCMLFILYRLKMLGAGDIKLICALGGTLGWRLAGKGILYAFALGAGMGVVFMLSCKNMKERLGYFVYYLKESVQRREPLPYRSMDYGVEMLHFTLPVLLGILLGTGGIFG